MRHVAALLLACACASSGPATGIGRSASTTVSVGSAGEVRLAPRDGPNVNTLDAAVDRVWKVLPAAFDSVGVPVSRIDVAGKSIGNEGFKIRQRLGKVPLSRYVDCGTTQIGPNADSYDVFMTLIVQLMPAGTATKVFTTFEASARPLAFSQEYSRCTSRGSLESRLLGAIRAQLK